MNSALSISMTGPHTQLIGFLAAFSLASAATAGTVTGVSLSTRTIVAGGSVSVTVTGSNPCGAAHIIYGDGTAITYAISELPVTQTHVYAAAGAYTITARGMGNCDGEATTTLTVIPPPPPPAPAAPSASISNVEMAPSPAKAGDPVAIIVRGSGRCVYDVQYGDGTAEQVDRHLPQDTHHTYTRPGNYTVIVKPNAPCVGKFTQILQVTERTPRPAARITHVVASPARGVTAETITVSVHGTGACPYDVYYGDGKVQQVTGVLPQETLHAYESPGTYRVLVKPHPPCTGDMSDTVRIAAAPPQSARITRALVSPAPAVPGRPVSITIEGTGTCSFTIDYGDGNWDSKSVALPDTVRHVYARAGVYTVLAVADSPCSGSGRHTFRVARVR
jgi:hypothetical protein